MAPFYAELTLLIFQIISQLCVKMTLKWFLLLAVINVVCEPLEIIVPAVKTACQAPGEAHQLRATCLGALTTLIDASLDIPILKLSKFLARLIICLDDSERIRVAALLLVKKDNARGERRVVVLFSQLEVVRGVETLLGQSVNTGRDGPHPMKIFWDNLARREEEAVEKADEWDVLRLTATTNFKIMVGQVVKKVSQMLNMLIEATILTNQEYWSISVHVNGKLKKNIVNQSQRLMEYSFSLWPPSLFLQMTWSMFSITTPGPSVRQRALEAVSPRLFPQSPILSLSPLTSTSITLAWTEDQPYTQQLALLAVRQLAKLLHDPRQLLQATETFTYSFLSQIWNPNALGVTAFSFGDILTCMCPFAVGRVPGLVGWLCPRLEGEEESNELTEKEVAVVCNSFLYCLQRLVDAFVGFIHPHLPRLVAMSCKLTGSSPSTIGRSQKQLTCLAITIPPHTTLFVADNCRRLDRGQLASVPHYSSIRGSWNMKFVGARLRGGVQDSPSAPVLPEANREKEDMFAESESEGDEVSPEINVERKSRQTLPGSRSNRGSSRSQSSGEDVVFCECGQRFGRNSSLVRHRNFRCSLNIKVPTGTKQDKKRHSAPSPQLTPQTSGAKCPVVRDGDI